MFNQKDIVIGMHTVCLIVALLCFAFSAAGVSARLNLQSLGLFFFVLSMFFV